LNYSSSNRGFPAGNPIANALVIVVGALAIGASLVLGFFAFLILTGLILIFASVVAVRVWWFRRKLKTSRGPIGRPRQPSTSKQPVIEGEFRVVEPTARGTDDEGPSR
jgi:membrane protein implicated in regulation of membrane protease activity